MGRIDFEQFRVESKNISGAGKTPSIFHPPVEIGNSTRFTELIDRENLNQKRIFRIRRNRQFAGDIDPIPSCSRSSERIADPPKVGAAFAPSEIDLKMQLSDALIQSESAPDHASNRSR